MKRGSTKPRRDAGGCQSARVAAACRSSPTPKNGRWTWVGDAWFFKEGGAQRCRAAKYAEFRVAVAGRALRVGMSEAELKPIQPGT